MRTTAAELDFDTSNNVSNISQNDNIHFKLKKLFRDYHMMTTSIRQGLNHLGFSVEGGKTHYKVFFKDNPHPIVISKTASDCRSGLNFVRYAMTVVRQTR